MQSSLHAQIVFVRRKYIFSAEKILSRGREILRATASKIFVT